MAAILRVAEAALEGRDRARARAVRALGVVKAGEGGGWQQCWRGAAPEWLRVPFALPVRTRQAVGERAEEATLAVDHSTMRLSGSRAVKRVSGLRWVGADVQIGLPH